MGLPQNPQLPLSYQIPGVYTFLDLNGPGPSAANRRALLLGYKTSAGTKDPNVPVQVISQSDANTYFGRGSDAARLFAAFTAQLIGGTAGADIWACPLLEPSGGTAATRILTFLATPTAAGAIDNNTSAQAAGIVDVYICGYRASVGVANGELFSTIAANVKAAIDLLLDIPVTAGVAGAAVTLTYRHKGAIGEELPIIVSFSNPAMKVGCSCGTVTIANGPSGGAGSITLTVNTQAVQAAIANTTSDTNSAAALRDAINTSIFPCKAASTAGVVTLYYGQDRVVERISVLATAIAPQTATADAAAIGVTGAGAPTLTTALTQIAAAPAFKVWVSPFTDLTTVGTLASHIEAYSLSPFEKGQTLHLCSTLGLSSAGAIPTGTTPALTSSPRYAVDWCPGSPQQGYELAARTAARVVAESFLPKNYDSEILRTTSTVPLLLPHQAERASQNDQNSAMVTYFLTPLIVSGDGNLIILSGKTTLKPGDQRLTDWGTILVLDYYRDDLRSYLWGLFRGKSIKNYGTPRTPNTVQPSGVKDAVYARMLTWEDLDYFDGAEQIRNLVQAAVNVQLPTRIDVSFPMRPPAALHQISNYGSLVG